MIRDLVPFGKGFNSVQNEFAKMESMLNDVFSDDLFWSPMKSTFPKVDITESDEDFKVAMATAGFKKKDLQIKITDKAVMIKGEKNDEKENIKYHQKELCSRKFEKMLMIPNSVDRDKIKAKYEDGVLEITLPKKEKDESKGEVRAIEIE